MVYEARVHERNDGATPPDGYVSPRFVQDFPGGVPIRHVLAEDLLLDLWEEYGDFGAAFVEWGTRLTEGYDRAHAEGRLPEQQFIELPEYVVPSQSPEGRGVAHPEHYLRQLRAALLPHNRNGRSMRNIAQATGLDLYDVVLALASGNEAVRAAEYADLEEAAIAAPPGLSVRALAEHLGCSKSTAHRFTKMHRSA